MTILKLFTMMFNSYNFLFIFIISYSIINVVPVQLQMQEGEIFSEENNVEDSQLNECMSVQRGAELGVCFSKELLRNLNHYDEVESFSLANGVSFVRDEKTPRHFGNFLDRDPMDFRSIVEDASELISKRSLHWDLSALYPGLIMKVGPTLANGILEFVIDPKIKDRTFAQPAQTSTGRLLARNLLVPFLLGFKFQISTLLPILLGLLLVASKKAFILAKLALIAVTVFGLGSNYGNQGSFGDYGGPSLSSYTSWDNPQYHIHHGHGGYNRRHPHHSEYYHREKSSEASSVSPITPDELRDRLERLFVTKKDNEDPREEKIRNARNFAWTPINAG